jgi:(p)ppGpp synthase/HD superfamily hydrolase
MSWSITPSDVIRRVLACRQSESLIRLEEACALIERTCSDPTSALGPHFRALAFNVAVELAPLLDADTIATAMLYPLAGLTNVANRESVARVLGVCPQDADVDLVCDLLRFSSLEWNTWPAVPRAYRSDSTQEMLKRTYLFAVGPVTEEERRSRLFAETKFHHPEMQQPNLVNLLGAVSRDWRVVYIKIAERLCLTRMLGTEDIGELPSVDAIAYARINLAVYAALAERHGTWQLKSALEDASLALLDPVGYRAIEEALWSEESERVDKLERIIASVEQCLRDERIGNATVHGRQKHIYAIYRKMKCKGRAVDQMIDLLGIRIVIHPEPIREIAALEERVAVAAAAKAAANAKLRAIKADLRSRSGAARADRTQAGVAREEANKRYREAVRHLRTAITRAEATAIDNCYSALVALWARWLPAVDFFEGHVLRDWIKHPRENGYQSLHTSLSVDGTTVEVQIRTQRMDEQNRFGSAAYSAYKSEKNYGSIQPDAKSNDSIQPDAKSNDSIQPDAVLV